MKQPSYSVRFIALFFLTDVLLGIAAPTVSYALTTGPNQTEFTEVVPVLQKIDGYFNKPGATTLHEVVESYLGGTMSQQAGTSSSGSGTPGSVYDAAHAAAEGVAPQAGTYTTKYLDRQGNPMPPYQARQDPSQVGRVNNVVQEGTRPAQVVQTVP